MNRKTLVAGLIALGIITSLIIGCVWLVKKIWRGVTDKTETTETTQPEPPKPNLPITNIEDAQKTYLALGNPSNATGSLSNADNYLMVNNAYALSYNNSRGSANWVAWRIAANDFGAVERQDNFRPDPNLPKTFTREAVSTADIYVRVPTVQAARKPTARHFI
jgi:DNA/RNA endonuclease G (NUC1)